MAGIAKHSPKTLRAHCELLKAWLDTMDADCNCDDGCPFAAIVIPQAEMPNDDLVPFHPAPGGKYTICLALRDIKQALER